ncbi:MAG: hypothetical protein M0R74_09985 [Dehalococcoidia bacterium]|nr:hypothetical protein [Dehalococcoidia bacterium]
MKASITRKHLAGLALVAALALAAVLTLVQRRLDGRRVNVCPRFLDRLATPSSEGARPSRSPSA